MSNPTELPDLDRRSHELKTDPEVFAAVLAGAKTHEIRLNDRGFAVGDMLVLRETVHAGEDMRRAGMPLLYTGRTALREVSHIQTGYGLAPDWCILSFARRAQPEGEAPRGAEAQVFFDGAWKPASEKAFYCMSEKNRRVVDRPEGEAPQVSVGVQELTYCQCGDRTVSGEHRVYSPCRITPAAQHADSGAPAANGELPKWLDRKLSEWGNAVVSSDAGHKAEMLKALIAGVLHFRDTALAAQSQGAQAATDDMEAFAAWKGYPLPALNSDGHFDKDWLHREWVAFRAGRAALAAKAEAPAPDDFSLLAALADAADVFMKGGVAPLRPLIDRAKAVTSGAQQAAAPGPKVVCSPNCLYGDCPPCVEAGAAPSNPPEFEGIKSAPGTPEAPADMRAAADFIDKRAEQYLQDHASHETDTGAVSFHYGEAGRDYHSTLVELADDLRQASKPAVCTVPPAGWHCTRSAGHEGPCAAIHRAAQLDGGKGEALTRCAAGRDGECGHKACPQLRDKEPAKSGRHCPLDQEGSESNG